MLSFASSQIQLVAEAPRETPQVAWLVMVSIAFVVFYLTIIRPAKRDRRRHLDLICSLKKNDRVVTSGGIIGLFVSVSSDGREITLRVDEDVRLKFHRNYIVGVLNEEKKDNQ